MLTVYKQVLILRNDLHNIWATNGIRQDVQLLVIERKIYRNTCRSNSWPTMILTTGIMETGSRRQRGTGLRD